MAQGRTRATEKLPQQTAWKQDKERRAAAAEGRAPKIGQPGTKDTTWGKGPAVARRAGAVVAARGRRADAGTAAAVRGSRRAASPTPPKDGPELLVGRNPVVEALRAARAGDRALRRAWASTSTSGSTRSSARPATAASPILEISRAELDRMTGGVLHQGVGLQVPPFAYEPFDDLLAAVAGADRRRCWSRWTGSPTRATSAR